MLKFVQKSLFGNHSDRLLKKYRLRLAEIEKHEKGLTNLPQSDFAQKTEQLKQRHQQGETLNQLIPEAFALVRQAALKTIQERHYDVQLLGGIALHEGQVAEMKTGEGKTLTSTLAVYLNALPGQGVHVVTVNDYLAKRDAEWMGQIYQFLGLKVGLIQQDMQEAERKAAYLADVTYGTNNEFGFDYLRDNMKFSLEDCVQRGHHYAIVDEVDSILIDEARTPLIISGAAEGTTEKYSSVHQVLHSLHRASRVIDHPPIEQVAKFLDLPIEKAQLALSEMKDTQTATQGDYTLDEKTRNIQLTEQGAEKLEKRLPKMLASPSLYDFENIEVLHHVNQALKAVYVFKKDVDYVVQENRVVIVDEFTGRLMEGRRFSDGLHQALEAKEKVQIQQENQTLASITFQNYFRKYKKLAGMTGTAQTEEEELNKIYGLGVVVVPTNRTMVRQDFSDLIYKTQPAKYQAILHQIQTLHQKKQPVLVGTDSIESSVFLAKQLKKSNIPHQVLNAKFHEQEANIIANAGQKGAVTIATNMAGRGTDIKLEDGVVGLGGLYILGTVRHESRRIDNQLRGRSGRQGDPGESRFFLSLEDDLLRVFGGERIAKLMTSLKFEEDEAIEHALITRAIANAQKKVEAQNFNFRKHLLEYDDVLNRQREIIYSRRQALQAGETAGMLEEMGHEALAGLLSQYCPENKLENWDVSGLQQELHSLFSTDWPVEDQSAEQMKQGLHRSLDEMFEQRHQQFGKHAQALQRHVLLEISDQLWKEHLLSMDHLKEGIGLRSFAQKNPLSEYKREGFYMFQGLMESIATECLRAYFSIKIRQAPAVVPKKQQLTDVKLHGSQDYAQKPKTPIVKTQQTGRNQPCPCGSGKKYKHCCLKQRVAAVETAT